MATVNSEIKDSIRKAVVAGDLRRLKSLGSEFPEVLDSMACTDLVDVAQQRRHADILIYLIVEHGFEVSPNFEKDHKKFGGEYFADGVNEYHQTHEVLANAAFGFAAESERRKACYGVRYWAEDTKNPFHIVQEESLSEKPVALEPEFVRVAACGKLAEWVARRRRDERYEMIPTAHSATMINALSNHRESVQARAGAMLQAGREPNSPSQSEGRGGF